MGKRLDSIGVNARCIGFKNPSGEGAGNQQIVTVQALGTDRSLAVGIVTFGAAAAVGAIDGFAGGLGGVM